jgi:hypothetical protein
MKKKRIKEKDRAQTTCRLGSIACRDPSLRDVASIVIADEPKKPSVKRINEK